MAELTEEDLKFKLNEASAKANKAWNDLPQGLGFDGYEKAVDKIYKNVNKINREYRLIKTPKLMDFSDLDKECLMSFKDFKECVESGGFIDYDGHGVYANKDQVSDISCKPSDFKAGKVRSDFEYICWYNR